MKSSHFIRMNIQLYLYKFFLPFKMHENMYLNVRLVKDVSGMLWKAKIWQILKSGSWVSIHVINVSIHSCQ